MEEYNLYNEGILHKSLKLGVHIEELKMESFSGKKVNINGYKYICDKDLEFVKAIELQLMILHK